MIIKSQYKNYLIFLLMLFTFNLTILIKESNQEVFNSQIVSDYLGFKKVATIDFFNEIKNKYLLEGTNKDEFMKDLFNVDIKNIYKFLTQDNRIDSIFKNKIKNDYLENDFIIIIDAKIAMEYLKYSLLGKDGDIFLYNYIIGKELNEIFEKVLKYVNTFKQNIEENIKSNSNYKMVIKSVVQFLEQSIKISKCCYKEKKEFDCLSFFKKLAGIKDNIEMVLFSQDKPIDMGVVKSMKEAASFISNIGSYSDRIKRVYGFK